MSRVLGPLDPDRTEGRLRAELEDGTQVICARHGKPEGITTDTLLERVRELAKIRHPNLLPVLGGGLRGESLWIFSDDDAGISLERLLARHALTPAQAVAVALSVLTGLQGLQREGFGHGAIEPRNVQVAGFGQVRLMDYGMTARPEARTDVAAAGKLICTLFGVDNEKGTGGAPGRNERAFPGLVATALTIAGGNAGRSATTALNMLTDAAGRLGSRGRVYLSVAELERLVGNERPAIRSAVDSVVTRRGPRPSDLPAASREDSKPASRQLAPPASLTGAATHAEPAPAPRAAAIPLPAPPPSALAVTAPIRKAALPPPPPAAPAPAPAPIQAASPPPPAPAGPKPAPAPRQAATMPPAAALTRAAAPLPVADLRPAAANLPVTSTRPATATRSSAVAKGRPSRRLGPVLMVAGALLLVVAGLVAIGHRTPPAPATGRGPVAAAAPAPIGAPPPAAAPAAAGAPDSAAAPATETAPATAAVSSSAASQAPDTVVRTFYADVVAHRFDAALTLWDDHMRAAYPPDQNLNQRFAGTTSLTVNQAAVRSQDATTAVVYTDLTEVTDGVEHHWVGPWTLIRSGQGWLLDQPNFQPA